jgi:hypothetical protein
MPPATERISPVIHADAAEARKRATGLRSDGRPGRFSRGVAAINRASAAEPEMPKARAPSKRLQQSEKAS